MAELCGEVTTERAGCFSKSWSNEVGNGGDRGVVRGSLGCTDRATPTPRQEPVLGAEI